VLRVISRLFFLTIILAVAALPILAQQIQGQVRYADNSQSVIGVQVRCDGTGGNSIQITDRDGKFYFRVSPGHYTVTVKEPGFIEEQQSVDLIDTQQSEWMNFRLKVDIKSGGAGPRLPRPAVRVAPDAQKEFDKAQTLLASDKKESKLDGVSHLEKALKIDPSFLEAQLRLGTAYMDLEQWDKAEQRLRKALEIDPKAANAYFALGEIYLRQKKYDEGEKVLQEGIAIEARSAQSHLTLARVFWDKVATVKDEAQWRPPLEKSYEEVKQALTLDPNLAGAHLLKGNLLLRVRRAEDAMHEFEEYLRLDPKGPFAEQTRTLIEKIKKALATQPK
jgi:tetratricopeptide (TPR) repeat protein